MKRRILSLILALSLGTALCACAQTGEESEGFRLWFAVGEEDWALVSTALGSVPYEGEESVSAVMEALLAGPPEGSGLSTPIPAGTRLLDWSLRGGVAQVDLTQAYGGLVGIDLTLADYCITLTLTQLQAVEAVRITVNGAEVPYRSRQVFRAEDVVFSGAEEEPVELSAALCFRRVGSNELGVELRSFRLTESESPTLAVLQALISGPRDAGLEAILPAGVEVYSARVDDGVCYADFSAALLEGMPQTPDQRELLLRSITETLTSLGYVQGVQILVEGEPLTTQEGQLMSPLAQ